MKLSDILEGVATLKLFGKLDADVCDICYDSRKVKNNTAFVCLRGANVDGHKFISSAVSNGANVIVTEEALEIDGVSVVVVENTRKALALMSANFFGNPALKLTTIGITGTKGKTTTA